MCNLPLKIQCKIVVGLDFKADWGLVDTTTFLGQTSGIHSKAYANSDLFFLGAQQKLDRRRFNNPKPNKVSNL